MSWNLVPWTELMIALPILGAIFAGFSRDRGVSSRWTLGFASAALCCSLAAWLVTPDLTWWDSFGLPTSPFAVDGLSGPLLPLVALLYTLTVLSFPKAEGTKKAFVFLLVGEATQLAILTSTEPWLLAGLLALGTLPPLAELVGLRKPVRVYALHMGTYVTCLFVGVALLEWLPGMACVVLMLGVLVRSGTVPAHLWLADLFEHAPFGAALLFVAPLTGVYAAVRLILPLAPDWVLQGVGLASLLTAVYAAALAVVQRDARRLLAYLFLTHASFVLVGLELHTSVSLTGALCLWVSVALSLGGMGLTLRALEARFGRLSLTGYHGLYAQSPALAVCFLLTGLASVGFPGTLGFVAADLLAEGAVEANPYVGVALVLAAALNGIAVLRGYLLLFTGTRRESSGLLAITRAERFALLLLAGLILGGGLIPHPGVADRHRVAEELLAKRQLGLAEEEDSASEPDV